MLTETHSRGCGDDDKSTKVEETVTGKEQLFWVFHLYTSIAHGEWINRWIRLERHAYGDSGGNDCFNDMDP